MYFGSFSGPHMWSINHIFSIMFAVVKLENNDSWTWFLVQLQDEMVDIEPHVAIIIDR